MSCGIGRRRGSHAALLCLWHRLVAMALIRPAAWEPPYNAGVAQEMAKRQKKKPVTLSSEIKPIIQHYRKTSN